jgi:hypothetical protein
VSGVLWCGIDHAMRSATLDIMRVIFRLSNVILTREHTLLVLAALTLRSLATSHPNMHDTRHTRHLTASVPNKKSSLQPEPPSTVNVTIARPAPSPRPTKHQQQQPPRVSEQSRTD